MDIRTRPVVLPDTTAQSRALRRLVLLALVLGGLVVADQLGLFDLVGVLTPYVVPLARLAAHVVGAHGGSVVLVVIAGCAGTTAWFARRDARADAERPRYDVR